MQAALDRYLRDQGCSYSILKDRDFVKSRKTLNGKAIELQEMGKGKRARKADPLSPEDEKHLWSTGVLGGENPPSLNFTIFFLLSQYFGTRGRQEHHQIRVEDLKIVRDASNGEMASVEWVKGPTKTRKSGLHKRPRAVSQKIFKTSDPRCPVAYIEKLLSKWPLELRESGRLYLAPLSKYTQPFQNNE